MKENFALNALILAGLVAVCLGLGLGWSQAKAEGFPFKEADLTTASCGFDRAGISGGGFFEKTAGLFHKVPEFSTTGLLLLGALSLLLVLRRNGSDP